MGKRQKRPTSILRIKVKGPHIKPGRIPIPELLVICEHAQAAVNRQAEVLRGKPGLRPGPTSLFVKAECTLELFSITRGSAAASFAGSEQSSQQPGLDLKVESLGEAAVREVVRSLRETKRSKTPISMDLGVKRSLQEMATVLNDGVSSIEWIAPAIRGKHPRVAAVFDNDLRERLSDTVAPKGTTKQVSVDGRLEMADFHIGDLKCVIHTSTKRITCSFLPEQEDDVYNALRHIARVTGKAAINAKTRQIDQIEISSVVVLDPLLGNAGSFFSTLNVDQLTRAQGVDPTFDLRTLKSAWPEDEDVDAFLAAIESAGEK